jgi:alpha-ketoglutarate-dependent taurine dioxygenase
MIAVEGNLARRKVMLETTREPQPAGDAALRTLDHIVDGKKAWVRADLRRDDWFFKVPAECLAELKAILPELRQQLKPVERIDPGCYELPQCRAFMQRVQAALDEGVRFAVVDRLPMDELSDDEAQALYWILSSFLARPVQQKLTGTMIYQVHDTGQKAAPGSGVRPDQTNMDQYFHNDNSYNTTPPEYVALLCVRPAKSGGISHVISFYTISNELLRAHRHVVPRLYREFWFDRQKENAPDEPEVMAAPMFVYDGRLRARLGLFQIRGGYTLKNETMDPEAITAIETLRKIFADEALTFDFVMERGQMQFVNNRELCHKRTQFEDFDDPQDRRLLMRLWLRNAGSMRYQG